MHRRSLLSALAGPPSIITRLKGSDEVDVLLVLAADTSSSIAPDEAKLQREGYCRGMTDPKVIAAIEHGLNGAVGVAYVEWSGVPYQSLVLP